MATRKESPDSFLGPIERLCLGLLFCYWPNSEIIRNGRTRMATNWMLIVSAQSAKSSYLPQFLCRSTLAARATTRLVLEKVRFAASNWRNRLHDISLGRRAPRIHVGNQNPEKRVFAPGFWKKIARSPVRSAPGQQYGVRAEK